MQPIEPVTRPLRTGLEVPLTLLQLMQKRSLCYIMSWYGLISVPSLKGKLATAQQLRQEQLQAGHIIPSNSLWNMQIFVIKKKSGKWLLLKDLRAVNKTMVLMEALQPGLPSPVAKPLEYFKVITDLKDCLFTIPLHPKDQKCFAFSLPSINF